MSSVVVCCKEHHWCRWYRCSVLEKERKGKETERKDRRKVTGRQHRRPVQRSRVKGDVKGNEEQKENKRKGWKPIGGLIPAHLANSYPLSQSRNTCHLERFSAAGTHPQCAPATTPVLALVICVADCAFDWCIGVARRQKAVVRAVALDLCEGHRRRVCICG